MVWALNYGFRVEGFNGFDETFMSYTSLKFWLQMVNWICIVFVYGEVNKGKWGKWVTLVIDGHL